MTNTAQDTITLTVDAEGLPDTGVATVYTFLGTDPETGENIVFAVDHRPAQAIIDAVEAEGEITVEVEDWQILGKGAF
jgi:hypothetical protein